MSKTKLTKVMKRDYEPPLSKQGSLISLGKPEYIWPGVFGYAVETNGLIYIPELNAEQEGEGAVGEFLDAITLRCRVVNVCSSRLEGMLKRRGFQVSYEETDLGDLDVWSPPVDHITEAYLKELEELCDGASVSSNPVEYREKLLIAIPKLIHRIRELEDEARRLRTVPEGVKKLLDARRPLRAGDGGDDEPE